MRGKGSPLSVSASNIGITPAYAGKRWWWTGDWKSDWDHPRLCGEKEQNQSLSLHRPGSPPPMRGKGISNVFTPENFGITPAYAGKRFRLWLGRS